MFAPPRLSALLLLAALSALATLPESAADGPKDNIVDNVRPVPPVGNDIPAADREAVQKGLGELQQLIKEIGTHELLADVLIYEKAVRWALDYREIYDPAPPKDKKTTPPPAGAVKKVLAAGLERARQLKDGKTPWATQTGAVLRGYTSEIDGGAQPYWLVVPADYDFKGDKKHRLDFWWHGRYENTVEAGFMANPPGAGGIIPAPGALVLHPFGRFSNANKFAGERDTFECLAHAAKYYRVDPTRLVARGFSMGGAACWQFGVHYPTLWAACAPGAGFSETPEFLKVFQKEDVQPTWYEQKLWHLYNATDYALNLFNLPTVAYSGEVDSQKQAADVMAREMKKVGLELTHVIGPKTGHSYEKGAKEEVNKLIDGFVAKGRPEPWERKQIKFTTYTLRYDRCAWLAVTGLAKHWEPAEVVGSYEPWQVDVRTKGVTGVAVSLWHDNINVTIDGKRVMGSGGKGENHFKPQPVVREFVRKDGTWTERLEEPGLVKKHGLQGPIDDAFMSAFLMVKPSGKPLNDKAADWAEKEMKHATEHWRKQFRGDAPVKTDTEVTDSDIKNSNLVLWGDPSSNAVLAKIADKLPISWTDKGVVVGKETYPVGTHVPVLIYPNPLNPSKYVVVNSGFTYREYDYLNNARQVPKLPDYAVVDITTPPNARYPGKVVRAGFFGEKWELLDNDGK